MSGPKPRLCEIFCLKSSHLELTMDQPVVIPVADKFTDKGEGEENSIKISAKPEFTQVSTNKINVFFMTSLISPVLKPTGTERAPIDLSVVIDKSGSMKGEKIVLTRITAKFITESLDFKDCYGLVTYDTHVNVVQPLQPVGQYRNKILHEIDQIVPGSSTNLSGGLLKGISQVMSSESGNKVAGVMLLTDGHANVGITSTSGITAQMAQLIGKNNCNVYSFGFGTGHNESMLKGISDAGGGEYSFIEKESDIPQAFADCLGGLTSVTCQDMQLTVIPAEGVTIKQVLGRKKKLQNQLQKPRKIQKLKKQHCRNNVKLLHKKKL